ncbi:MAG: hypothetical protein PWQ57_1215 [Desulfovibrionales bacterium]|nr:hypothetical protein [Desulfovibrionales bacterium]
MAKRSKTKYVGVTEHHAQNPATGKEDVAYYVRYRPAPGASQIEERVGWKSSGTTPARAANERAARIEGAKKSNQQRREEEAAERNRMTMARLWEAFKEAKSSNKSFKDDICRWGRYLEKPFADKLPTELVTLDVDRLRHRLTKQGLAPATVKHTLVLLKRIIRFGVRTGLCPAPDPSRLYFQMPKVDNLKTEDLTPEELTRLLKAMDDDPNQQVADLMRMALFTGMRRGELFRLQWDHIDFERGFIRLVEPKGGREQRIPLNDAARGLLKRHERTDSPYVFPGRGGGQRVDIRKVVNRIRDRACLPKDFRPLHGLRHVFASMLASSGQVDMYTLQKLLTHKSAAMTQRYAHLRDDALRHGADVAGTLFSALDQGREQRTKKVVSWSGAKGEG